ncbi:uncharacterized protein LOC116301480 [Actinia tenebrosa]|uniref:Uncharacterized protein LOC116301480 n=1 Tax=Actinia tenebrosa TaxID=6105 RepID=A0A6P8IHU9_ACTTE|nr:uncharacterized protein LOC116301480 [Actinia tenebrosa]
MARASTPQPGILNLRCNEYCDGKEAVFYCPQCSAMFCDSCYDREHEGSVRKQTHERVVEVRPICREHQHTLEYFDLTCLKPICITCLTNLQSKEEYQNHVIEKINDVSTKLCCLLSEKVVESKAVLKSVQKAAKNTSETTKRTLNMAKREVHDIIEQGKGILDERRQSIYRRISKVQKEFLSREDSTAGLIGLASRLEENIQNAERVSDEGRFISAQFPYLFNTLNDLCASARRHLDNPKGLKVTVTLSKVAVAKILSLVDVETAVVSPDEVPVNEAEDVIQSNCVRVVIMSDDSRSHSYIARNPITVRNIVGVVRPDSQDSQSQDERTENIMQMSHVHSKTLTTSNHGNQIEEFQGPGIHSNRTEVLESHDLYCKQENDIGSPGNHSNQANDLESCDLYGNPQQEDMETPSNHSNESEVNESPDVYYNNKEDIQSPGKQPEEPESPCVHGNLFENIQNRRIHGDLTPKNHSIPSNQAEDSESPDNHGNLFENIQNRHIHGDLTPKNRSIQGNQAEDSESPGHHGNMFENIQNRRIHGDLTPKNHSIHSNQAEDPESPIARGTVRSGMPDSPCIHGNHHVTKRVSKTFGTSQHVKLNSTHKKSKRGRKRKKRPSEDHEWTPTRILRPSTMERRKEGTVAKPRSRRGGELSQEMNRCDAILTILWADEDSWPFVHLVHKKRCPEYYKKISNPVSLDIIKQRLHSYQYRSVLDFVRDFNQIIQNCHVFNEPDSDVHQAGSRLALRFNNLLRECFPNIESVFPDQELMDSSL